MSRVVRDASRLSTDRSRELLGLGSFRVGARGAIRLSTDRSRELLGHGRRERGLRGGTCWSEHRSKSGTAGTLIVLKEAGTAAVVV